MRRRPPPPRITRDHLGLEDDGEASVPTGTSRDYSQCGKRALRDTGSRILVDTIEDAVRSGGVALLDENFRLDSSIGWVFGENVTGEIDAVVPLWGEDERALFVQPGMIFWTGLAEQERFDGNLGLVYRTGLSNTPFGAAVGDDAIGGASLFYDHDFERGHTRAGLGADIQSGTFHGAVNYYHPLSDTQEGREGYIEDALRGADLRVALEKDVMRVGANIGYWRFEGDEEVEGDWKPSYGFNAGIRIIPGVFLETEYDRQDEEVSFGSRWSMGLAFRFSLPDFKGASYGDGGMSSNLWKPVEREKRILYEERLGIPRVNLTATSERVSEPTTADESTTVVIEAELGKPLDEDVLLHVMVAETSTAILGADFTYAHRVYELDGATGEQSAPEGDAIDCPDVQEEVCEVMVPAGVTRFDIEVEILMTAEREIAEFIDFLIEVPQEHAHLLRDSVVERVTINGHGNEIGFAADAETMLAENNEMDGIQVSISIDRPSPTPFTLNVATSGTAVAGEDYNISGTSLAIPANAASASLTLRGINNNVGEGSKTIELMLSGDLPTGWAITDAEHEVTLSDDDLAIFFTSATPRRVEEPDTGTETVTVTVGITQAPTANIIVVVADDSSGTAVEGSGGDYGNFMPTEITFSPSDSSLEQTVTLTLLSDSDVAELDKTIVLALDDDPTESRRKEGSGFSLGVNHTITIAANDNTVAFATDMSSFTEGVGTTADVVVNVNQAAPVPITLNVAPSGTATEGTDYENLPDSVTIGARQASGTIRLTSRDDSDREGNETVTLEIGSNNLPSGWTLGSQTTHTVTLHDDDLSIHFVTSTGNTPSSEDEPDMATGNTSVTVTVGITQEPMANITVTLAAQTNTGDRYAQGGGSDYTFPTTQVMFTPSNHSDKSFTLTVHPDDIAEGDELIVLTLSDPDGTLDAEGSNFSLGAPHTITIPANDNTVAFATDASTLAEGAGTTEDVMVSVNRVAPVPITLNVGTGGTATEGRDYENLPDSLTIGARESSGTITLRGMEDDGSEGPETIELTLSVPNGSPLPDGWALGTQTTHTVTIEDNDLSIYFVTGAGNTPDEVVEPGTGDTSVTVKVGISQAPTTNITVKVAAGGTGQTVQAGDFTFAGENIMFTDTGALEQTLTATFNIHSDTDPEDDEDIVLTLADVGNSLMNTGFTLGPDHTITIPANGRVVRFASGSATTLDEADGMAASVMVEVAPTAPADITVSIATGGQATEGGANPDYTISPSTKSLTISAGQSSGTIMLTGVNDTLSEGNETITLTLSATSALPPGYTVDATPYVLTLIDDDLSAGFTADGTSVLEPGGGSGGGSHTAMVMLTQSPAEAVNLMITPSGTAMSNEYTLSTTMVSFAKGATGDDLEQPVMISITPDDDSEPDETIVLTLSDMGGSLKNGANDFELGRETFTLTIPTNDNTVGFTAITGQGTLGEAVGPTRRPSVSVTTTTWDLRVTIADNLLPENVDINIKRGGTATEGEDYTIAVASPATASYASGVLTIPANEAQVDLTVTIIDDPADDWEDRNVPAENIELTLEDPDGNLPSGWGIDADNSMAENLTIIDNDRAVFFQPIPVGSRTAVEGEHIAQAPDAFITASADLATDILVPLTVTTATGTTTAFLLEQRSGGRRGTITDSFLFRRGNTNGRLRMQAIEDTDTFNETVTVTIDPDRLPSHAAITGNNVWQVEIRDNDARTVFFNRDRSSVTEGGSVSNAQLKVASPFLDADVRIPIRRISGDGDIYTLSASHPASATVTRDANDDTLHYVQFIRNEDSDQVDLEFTALEDNDDRFDDTVIFTMNQADMPAGYNASSRNWEVRITDNDKRVISFTDRTFTSESGGKTVAEGDSITVDLNISPALTGNFSVPIMVTGDEDSYRLTASAPASASISNGMIHFIQSENASLVTLRFEARNDSNNVDETINVTIDEDSLPGDYIVQQANKDLQFNIMDDDDTAVSFRFADGSNWGNGRVSMFEGDIHKNLELHISMPVSSGSRAAGIPLRVTGHSDAFWFYDAPSAVNTVLSQNGQNYRASFFPQGDILPLEFRARTDGDHATDRITIAIDEDNLPDGFYLGANTSVVFDIRDRRQTYIEFYVLGDENRIPDEQAGLNITPKVGDIVNIRLRIRPRAALTAATDHFQHFHLNAIDSATGYSASLDDHPRGTGNVVDVHTSRVSRSEVNLRYTVTGSLALYSVWIAELYRDAGGAIPVIGNAGRVTFRTQP